MRKIRPVFILFISIFLFSSCDELNQKVASAKQSKKCKKQVNWEAQGQQILDIIVNKESTKDATCWTTVRQMENFYATLPLSPKAALLKIEASRVLLFKIWKKASYVSDNIHLDANDIIKVIPTKFRANLEIIQNQNFIKKLDPKAVTSIKHYHRVTENYRNILSVIMNKIAKKDILKNKNIELKSLSIEAMNVLAQTSTLITIDLLRDSAEIAKQKYSHQIFPLHLKEAFKKVSRTLENNSSAYKKNTYCQPGIQNQNNAKLTMKNILNKIKALRSWNKKVWEPNINSKIEKNTIKSLIEQYHHIKISNDLFNKIYEINKNYVTSYNEKAKLIFKKNNFHIPLNWFYSQLDFFFPTLTLKNADIMIKFVPRPIKNTRFIKPKKSERFVTLKAEYTDSFRDTTFHWAVIRDVWSKNTDLSSIDPFAAELLSESVSHFAAYLFQMAIEDAKNEKSDIVTIKHFKKYDPEKSLYLATQFERENENWTKNNIKTKKYLTEKFKNTFFFINQTYDSGIITHKVCNDDILIRKDIDFLNKITGSGIAVGDFNNDNFPDLFIAGEGCNRLYQNIGNHKFKDVTSSIMPSPDINMDSTQPIFADINNDGKLDLFIAHRLPPSKLYIQNKKGIFVDKTEVSQIKTNKSAFNTNFFDYDNDGLLDLYIGYYGTTNSKWKGRPTFGGKNAGANQLYKNLGNGVFKDISQLSGLNSTSWTLASIAYDINKDGYTDLYLANDFGHDEVFLNLGKGRFKELKNIKGIHDFEKFFGANFTNKKHLTDKRGHSMNASLVDINRDGFLDIYVTDIDMFSKSLTFVLPDENTVINLDDRILNSAFYLSGNKLLLNLKGKGFAPVENKYFEPGDKGWGWGAQFFDYNNDGNDDVYITNGYLPFWVNGDQKNQFYLNVENKLFKMLNNLSHESFSGNSRSVVAIDFDNKGKLDLIVSNFLLPPFLLVNNSNNKNNWIKIKLRGVKNNYYGIGTDVKITVKNKRPFFKTLTCGSGYLSQDGNTLFFGLGKAKTIQSIELSWPGGNKQLIKGPIQTNKTIIIKEEISKQKLTNLKS